MAEWREHLAGPILRHACLCDRCGEVLFVADWQTTERRRFAEGVRVASNGIDQSMQVTGWPYTACEPWQPRMGDRPAPAVAVMP